MSTVLCPGTYGGYEAGLCGPYVETLINAAMARRSCLLNMGRMFDDVTFKEYGRSTRALLAETDKEAYASPTNLVEQACGSVPTMPDVAYSGCN